MMEKIIIPYFMNHVSPRIEYAETFVIVIAEEGKILSKDICKIAGESILEKINIIVRLKPDVIICNGISESIYEKLKLHNISVYSWKEGPVDKLIEEYIIQQIEKQKV